MLTRKHRFHGYGSVRRVYSRSKTIRSPFIRLRYSLRPPGKPYRVAVVVSRKVHKSAVIRNRIRRRIYEVVRTLETAPPAVDLVFSVHSDQVAEMPQTELVSTIDKLLKGIELTKSK
jgi:ribonuclease P protein component